MFLCSEEVWASSVVPSQLLGWVAWCQLGWVLFHSREPEKTWGITSVFNISLSPCYFSSPGSPHTLNFSCFLLVFPPTNKATFCLPHLLQLYLLFIELIYTPHMLSMGTQSNVHHFSLCLFILPTVLWGWRFVTGLKLLVNFLSRMGIRTWVLHAPNLTLYSS